MDFELQPPISNPETCVHHYIPTKYTKAHGVEVVRPQCIFCGGTAQEVSKKDYDLAELPEFSEDFRRRGWDLAQAERSGQADIQRAIVQQRADSENRRWWDDYNLYLASMEWRMLRRRILERDKDCCQGCLKTQGVEVHHLSYEMYNATGHSMAFECVTLCRECHERIHPHMKEARRRITTASWLGV